MQFYTVQSRISDNLDCRRRYHDFLFLCLSHCHCFCWFANTNLCVLEERRALRVGNNDLFYLLLLFPPSPLLFLSLSPWLLCPLSVPLYSFTSFFCFAFVFSICFHMLDPSARTHEHTGWHGRNWHTSEHKDKHVACVYVRSYSWIYHLLGFFFVSEVIMNPPPLSTYTSPIGSEVGEWSSAQWMPVWKPWDDVLAQGPFDSLLGCKKSYLVKCGCNSMHITLARFKTREMPATLKFLSSHSKVCCCSSVESNAVSPVWSPTFHR